MAKATAQEKQGGIFLTVMMGIGAAIGLWAMVALAFSLGRADWQVSELLRQYLVAVGVIGEFETLVDFYTHIKGVEYIICVAFLAAFPAFFKALNRTRTPITTE